MPVCLFFIVVVLCKAMLILRESVKDGRGDHFILKKFGKTKRACFMPLFLKGKGRFVMS